MLLNNVLIKSLHLPTVGAGTGRESALYCAFFFFFFAAQVEEKRASLGYVQVQEIDSLILKIQQLSFITFRSLFPFPCGVGKYHSLLNYSSEKSLGMPS